VLEVRIEGRPLGEWLFDELRRRHVHLVLDHLLTEQGRSAQGARGVLRAFSTMTEDAIGDDFAEINAFRGVRLRANDPRVRKPPRRIRIWSFEQMREFAAAGRSEIRAKTPRSDDPRSKHRYRTKERFYFAAITRRSS
jgi:hypothetical protein